MMPNTYSPRHQGWLPALLNDYINEGWMPSCKCNITTPAVNVSEEEKGYKVEVAAPGMNKKDFKVVLTSDGNLVISMEKKTEKKNENEQTKYLRHEFNYSKFEQRLSLPENVETLKISACMNDGVLTIHLPKKLEQGKVKENQNIEIG
ncbi:MAG: Hsp20/alpha crystallin family protein [Bacteroidaceae bacterium]|nr:Hsp20/alpha crystallin family protein [Bacteroidaceae bacterium]MDO5481615.1 Hsp20/alpha crystallin family protein [Bacteroidaceae bacterium]